jgi:hypothetical protein
MTLNEWLTLAGIVLSPIAAVCITLWVEDRRKRRDSKMVIVRALMATRHLPGDANWSNAINLLPIEFNDCPAVMSAYKEYVQTIRREQPTEQAARKRFDDDIGTVQTKLVASAMRAVGLNVSEADLPVEAYAAGGFIARDNLYLASLQAQDRIATALETQVRQTGDMLGGGVA